MGSFITVILWNFMKLTKLWNFMKLQRNFIEFKLSLFKIMKLPKFDSCSIFSLFTFLTINNFFKKRFETYWNFISEVSWNFWNYFRNWKIMKLRIPSRKVEIVKKYIITEIYEFGKNIHNGRIWGSKIKLSVTVKGQIFWLNGQSLKKKTLFLR